MTDERSYASAPQLWRMNQIGLLRVVDFPDEALEEPINRVSAKEILLGAASEGLWEPKPARGEGGAVQWDSASS